MSTMSERIDAAIYALEAHKIRLVDGDGNTVHPKRMREVLRDALVAVEADRQRQALKIDWPDVAHTVPELTVTGAGPAKIIRNGDSVRVQLIPPELGEVAIEYRTAPTTPEASRSPMDFAAIRDQKMGPRMTFTSGPDRVDPRACPSTLIQEKCYREKGHPDYHRSSTGFFWTGSPKPVEPDPKDEARQAAIDAVGEPDQWAVGAPGRSVGDVHIEAQATEPIGGEKLIFDFFEHTVYAITEALDKALAALRGES
jgi:hypothetical protein